MSQIRVESFRLEDNAAAARTAHAGVSFASILSLGALGVFFVDNLLWFDSHMDNVGRVTVKSRV